MSKNFDTLPPVTVPPEDAPPPALADFRRRPAQHVMPGDLLLLSGEVWRVKARRAGGTSPRISFTLFPVAGGRPITESYFPREWVLSVVGY